MTSPFVSLWTSQSVALVLLLDRINPAAWLRHRAAHACRRQQRIRTRNDTGRQCWRHGVARDWRNQLPGRFLRVTFPWLRIQAAHHATFPVLPGARSKCRIGGADAGSAAANVNLIQPREKRKAFNEMKPASLRINVPAKGAPVVRAHFRSCTIGKNWNATTQKQIYPPLLTDHRADTQYFFLAKRRFSHPTLSHHTTIVSTPRVFPGAAAFFMRFTYCGLVVSPASRAAPCFSPFNRYSS